MSDVIDRLRAIYPEHHQVNQWCVRYEAATEIERLRAENEKLRAALKPFADCEVWEGYKGYERFVAGMFHIHNKGMDSLNISHIRAARDAYLGEKE